MDHLPLPRYPTKPRPRVPLVCGKVSDNTNAELLVCFEELPYDKESFLEYPHRKEAEIKPDATTGAHSFLYGEPFLQSWLFFGLLHEFLQKSYDPSDYVEQDDFGPAVHTRKLLYRLKSWQEEQKVLDDNEKDNVYQQLIACLAKARTVLGAVANRERHRDSFDKGIKFSLMAVAELLTHAIEDAYPEKPGDNPQFGTSYWDDEATADMSAQGWCRSEIARLRETFNTVSSYDYLRRLSKSRQETAHDACTEEECEVLNVDYDTYETRHVCERGKCEYLGVDVQADLMRCLDDDKLPLIRISGSTLETIAIEVVRQDANTPYVAISHVWADGLGNQFRNALPRCQLQRLRDSVDHLRRQVRLDRGDDVPDLLIWCDTLCCPTGSRWPPSSEELKQKAKALVKMREVYDEADFVLVLDLSLEAYAYDEMDDLEVIMRLLTSQWMHRLWTFQEGILAKDAIFQLKRISDGEDAVELSDCFCNLGHLLKRADDMIGAGLQYCGIAWEAFLQCYDIVGASNDDEIGNNISIETFATGLRYRRTSRAEDEPICIAGLMNYGHEAKFRIATARGLEEKMKEFWKQMPKESMDVPAEIIFSNCRRLTCPGFRWAPLSFRQHSMKVKPEFRIFGFSDPEPSTITDTGLFVRFPGYRINLQSATANEPLSFWRELVWSVGWRRCPIRLPDNQWFWLWGPRLLPNIEEIDDEEFWRQITGSEEQHALILANEPRLAAHSQMEDLPKVLWVSVKTQGEDGALQVRSHALVCLDEMRPSEQQVWMIADSAARQLLERATSGDIARLAARAQSGDLDEGLVQLAQLSIKLGAEVRSDGSMVEVLRQWTVTDAEKKLASLILEIAAGNFLVAEEMLGTDQAWIVD